jgi:hypothetical protein
MTDNDQIMRQLPVLGQLGHDLQRAYATDTDVSAQRVRRPRRRLILSAAGGTLAVSLAAVAIVSGGGPSSTSAPTEMLGASGATAVVLMHSDDPRWVLVSRTSGDTPCLSLRADAISQDSCAPAPVAGSVSVFRASGPGQGFVFGLASAQAATVRLTIDGRAVTTQVRTPTAPQAASGVLPAGTGFFVHRLASGLSSQAIIEAQALDAAGQLIPAVR